MRPSDPTSAARSVYTNTRAGFSAQCPNVGRLLQNLNFTPRGESELMADILDQPRRPRRRPRRRGCRPIRDQCAQLARRRAHALMAARRSRALRHADSRRAARASNSGSLRHKIPRRRLVAPSDRVRQGPWHVLFRRHLDHRAQQRERPDGAAARHALAAADLWSPPARPGCCAARWRWRCSSRARCCSS